MNVDLEQSLAELARAVPDEGTADRMTGQVRHLVTRVRRRRAARQTVTGVVGVGGVAAIALGGLQLADGGAVAPTAPVAPAAPGHTSEAPDPAPTPVPSPVSPAQDALATLVATGPSGVFPECGAGPATPDPASPLALDLGLDGRPYAPGEEIRQEVTVRTTGGRHVLANADAAGARLVLVRDGVVVGTFQREPSDAALLDLGPTDASVVALTGSLELCSDLAPTAGGPVLGLPPGAYQAYAVLDVALKEVTEANGEALSTSAAALLVSAPVEITVG